MEQELLMNGESATTIFDVALGALKDAYVHTPAETLANRILEQALNRIHSMPAEVADRSKIALLEAEVSTLREHLAEVNRLMSLNCRKVERLEEALQRIVAWAEAYPLDIFPEPDLNAVRKWLQSGGHSLDQVSASNMRHVIKGVGEIARGALSASVKHE